jgi:hypothetical protein
MPENNPFFVHTDQKEFKIKLVGLISHTRDITVEEVLDLLRLYPDERLSTTWQQPCFLTKQENQAELKHLHELKHRGD